jgi:hypothetical protein
MASQVDICNLAMSHFGQAANISSIDPVDGSAEAEHCARFYPIVLAELLEAANWTFARKRATLAEVTNDREDFGFKYAFPADCQKARYLLADGYTADLSDSASETYEIEGSFIYTDAADATLVYTKRLTDTTKFSGMFVTGFSLQLAAYVVGPITKDPSGRTQALLADRATRKLNEAKVVDANSERRRAVHRSTAERAR